MAPLNGYLSLAELKLALGETGSTKDALFEQAIEAASRQIDEYRGDQFWREAAPTPRLFRPDHPGVLWTGDFATTTGMTVAVDLDGNGSFDTMWPASEWQAEPLVRFNNRPYDRITLVGDDEFPVAYRRALVQVTATWGWPVVPLPVKQACQILAVDHYKSKDLTGGIAGFGELGPVRIAAFNPLARALLEQYRLP